MASDPKFSAWYFSYCQEHNRTPSQEEVWRAALAASEPVSAQEPSRPTFSEWWLSLPIDRRLLLSADKLIFAEAAYNAALAAAPKAPQGAPGEAVEPSDEEGPYCVNCANYGHDEDHCWAAPHPRQQGALETAAKEIAFKYAPQGKFEEVRAGVVEMVRAAIQSTDQKGAGE